MDVRASKWLMAQLSRPLHGVGRLLDGLLSNGSLPARDEDQTPPNPTPAPIEGLLEAEGVTRQLELEVERARRGHRSLSVLIGELRSDAAPAPEAPALEASLDRVAAAVVREKRQIDFAGRLDRTTVVLILPETDEQGAVTVAERMRASLSAALPQEASSSWRLSFGIAAFGRQGRTAAALLDGARSALVAAHAIGRDRELVASGEISAALAAVGRNGEPQHHLQTVLALAETVDVRDRGTTGHSQVVGRYAKQIARELGIADEVVERVRLAAVMRDVGKAVVSKAVLRKPDALDDEEWEAVRRHPQIGARILEGEDLADLRQWVLHHHERPDGRGYPNGLKNGEIPLASRIVAVAEAYEAMTSATRAYRAAMTHAEAQSELLEHAGAQFDRRVVQAFMRALERQGLRDRSVRAA